MNFNVVLIGTDINAYYMSRCYHELTGKKAEFFRPPFISISDTMYKTIKVPLFIKWGKSRE